MINNYNIIYHIFILSYLSLILFLIGWTMKVLKVKEIMHKITMVDKDLYVSDVAKLMSDKNIGSILTMDGDCVKMVTERDILKKIVALDIDPKNTRISEIMTVCEHSIDSDKCVFDASELLNKHNIRRLPVKEGKNIVGIVTARDIAKSISYASVRKLQNYGRRTYGRSGR